VKLWVRNFEAQPTLWTEQGSSGSLATGKWIVPGTEISMTDATGDKILAEIRIGRLPCDH
jgi:hypothetical protein